MNERDRLIDILSIPIYPANGVDYTEVVADYLLDNNVTIPPVSVGQTVYIIRRPTERPAWIDECEITYISVHYFKDGKSTVFGGYNFEVAECYIGKTALLTREEAERALREEESL